MSIEETVKAWKNDIAELVEAVQKDISDEYRAFEDDDAPGIQLTVATDDEASDYGWQTGDNSFTGGAYTYPHWAVVGVYRDSEPSELADDIIRQLLDLIPG